MSIEKDMVRIACKALDDKKAKDIKIIDIHEVSVIADYFVIASASNQNQVQAMVDNADEMLGRAGYEAKQIEGTRNSSWVLMDYGDMIIHIFDEENRLFYDLERIWRDGKILDTEEFLGENELYWFTVKILCKLKRKSKSRSFLLKKKREIPLWGGTATLKISLFLDHITLGSVVYAFMKRNEIHQILCRESADYR